MELVDLIHPEHPDLPKIISRYMNVQVCRGLLPELSRKLMTTISDLGFFLMDFCIEVLNNHLFLPNIFMVVLKESSNFSFVPFFNLYFEVISSCLAFGIVFMPSKFWGIKDKRASKCIHYPGENVIESFIIPYKTWYFFIYEQPGIIDCWPNFVINNRNKFSMCFPIDNVR